MFTLCCVKLIILTQTGWKEGLPDQGGSKAAEDHKRGSNRIRSESLIGASWSSLLPRVCSRRMGKHQTQLEVKINPALREFAVPLELKFKCAEPLESITWEKYFTTLSDQRPIFLKSVLEVQGWKYTSILKQKIKSHYNFLFQQFTRNSVVIWCL